MINPQRSLQIVGAINPLIKLLGDGGINLNLNKLMVLLAGVINQLHKQVVGVILKLTMMAEEADPGETQEAEVNLLEEIEEVEAAVVEVEAVVEVHLEHASDVDKLVIEEMNVLTLLKVAAEAVELQEVI